MAFSLWSTVYVDATGPNSALPAAFVNKIRTEMPSAVDGTNGGTYSPTVTLRFNGVNGVTVETFKIPSTGTATVQSGGLLTISAGADLAVLGDQLVDLGGTFTLGSLGNAILAGPVDVSGAGHVDFNTGTELNAENGSSIVLKSGADLQGDSGSTISLALGCQTTINGALIMGPTGDIVVNAAATAVVSSTSWAWGGGSVQEMNVSAVLNVNSGSHIDIETGADLFIRGGGTFTCKSSGTVTCDALSTTNLNGSCVFGAASTVAYTGGAAVSGTIADASTTTRTNPTIYSGNNGMRGDRAPRVIDITGLTGTTTLDAWKDDIIELTGDPGVALTYRLTTPTGNVRTHVWVTAPDVSAGQVIIKDDDSNTTIFSFTNDGAAYFYFNGTTWRSMFDNPLA